VVNSKARRMAWQRLTGLRFEFFLEGDTLLLGE
jgi:hypothetical protein